jgi:hypothetical protein
MNVAPGEKYWNDDRIAVALTFPAAIASCTTLLAFGLFPLFGPSKILFIPVFTIPLACSALAIFTIPGSFLFLTLHRRSIRAVIKAWCWIINIVWLLWFSVAIFPHI